MSTNELIGGISATTKTSNCGLGGSVETQQDVAKAWQEIFKTGKDKNFGPNLDTGQIGEVSTEKNKLVTPDQVYGSLMSSDYYLPKLQKEENVSVCSIIPGAITLSTELELREELSHLNRKSWNGSKLFLSSCCKLDKYTATMNKLSYASFKIEDFYNNLNKDLDVLEAELYFDTPAEFHEYLNIIGAQIWFVTLALGRQIKQSRLDTEHSKAYQTMYQYLVERSILLLNINTNLNITIINFEKVVTHCLQFLKRTCSGTSETDLAEEQIDVEPMIGQRESSITELAVRAMVNRKLWENKSTPRVKLNTSSSCEYMENCRDTLKQRQCFDIFIRNITKAGWVNFQVHVLPKARIELLEEILHQAVQGVKIIEKVLPRIEKKIKRSSSLCTCYFTCNPWVKKMVNYISFIVTNDNYNPIDKEDVRLHIFAVEIFLKNIITRGTILQKKIQNIVETILLSCDYLEQLFFFRIPNYDSLTRLKANISYGIPKKSTSKIYDDADFFMNDYIIVLKQVPIRYGMTEYILINKISISRQHSGADFDGPRFLKIS